MVQDKAAFIARAGVDTVVATDAGCLMNIAGCLHRQKSKLRALHLAEVLEKT
jgi:L-lactate dehydrogenase complex protein LldE